MKRKNIVVIGLVVVAAGCATKQYPIATKLSPAVAEAMTCRELHLQRIEGEEIERQINETGQIDGRSVLGFLGDFGIGNAIAQNEARSALSERISSIRAAQVRKGCSTD
jgi:hypothetical protein